MADGTIRGSDLQTAWSLPPPDLALSGDGGDELFAGYSRYLRALRRWNRIRGVPQPLRGAVGKALGRAREASWRMFAPENPFSGAGLSRINKAASNIGRRWCYWTAGDPRDLVAREFGRCHRGSTFVPGASVPETSLTSSSSWARVRDRPSSR